MTFSFYRVSWQSTQDCILKKHGGFQAPDMNYKALKLVILAIYLFATTSAKIKQKRPNVTLNSEPVTGEHRAAILKDFCASVKSICHSNDSSVCAVTFNEQDGGEFKVFDNACYVVVNNVCQDSLYYIVASGDCSQHNPKHFRRTVLNETDEFNVNGTVHFHAPNDSDNSTEKSSEVDVTMKPVARNGTETSKSTLYSVEDSYDGHLCPFSCTNEYKPICINVNRGYGMYFKYMIFLNHCLGDIYYCKHWQEFQPPEDESSEMVRNSPLDWSYCASLKFLQFARFSESVSSMGHYGWLLGDYKYSSILQEDVRHALSGHMHYTKYTG